MNHKEAVDYVKRELTVDLCNWAEIERWIEGEPISWGLGTLSVESFDNMIATIAGPRKTTAIRFVRTVYDCGPIPGRAIVDALLDQCRSREKVNPLTHKVCCGCKHLLNQCAGMPKGVEHHFECYDLVPSPKHDPVPKKLRVEAESLKRFLKNEKSRDHVEVIRWSERCTCKWKSLKNIAGWVAVEWDTDCPVHGEAPQEKTYKLPGFLALWTTLTEDRPKKEAPAPKGDRFFHLEERLQKISVKRAISGLLPVKLVAELIVSFEKDVADASTKVFKDFLRKAQEAKEKRACGFCAHSLTCTSLDRVVTAMKFIPTPYGAEGKQTSSGRPVLEALAAFCPLFERKEER